jgi:hypothetical protein
VRRPRPIKGTTPESWCCVDCGINTAAGFPSRIEMERAYNGAALRLEKPTISVQFNEHCEVYTLMALMRHAVMTRRGPLAGVIRI